MKPSKIGQLVTFRADRYRQYPRITSKVKGAMCVICFSSYENSPYRWVTVEDESGKTLKFEEYWLKTVNPATICRSK